MYLGYEKFKNLAVVLPGVGFGISGLYNILYPLQMFYNHTVDTGDLTLNFLSLSVNFIKTILASSIGEFYLFYKNMGDIHQEPPMTFRA